MGRTVQTTVVERACRPMDWLRAVADRPYPVLLESSLRTTELGRHSLLCWDPFRKVTCRAGRVEVEDLRTGAVSTSEGRPFRTLADQFAPHRLDAPDGFALPFAGGAVGYFSYDVRHLIERLPRACDYDLDVPQFVLCFYGSGLVFDHRADVTFHVGPEGSPPPEPPAPRAQADVPTPRPLPPIPGVELHSNFTPRAFMDAVQRTREDIAAGDIFQANLSQRFSGPCPAGGLEVYERLRAINPAPFGGYLRYPDFEIISSSPERFLLVEGDLVTTRPIKGTRPRRAGDAAFNRRMRDELLTSAKDHAELAMIVDLERNDLGRVCRYGSVRVREHAALEEYPTVYHLVSTVEGRLYRDRFDEFDLIRATSPGGSITGAPKVRAMEIIEELEPHARTVYTGAVGYLSFHGRMDLNIAIRTMLRTGGRIYMGVGGGIVADSDPAAELRETLHKGRALFEAAGARNFDEIMGPCDDER